MHNQIFLKVSQTFSSVKIFPFDFDKKKYSSILYTTANNSSPCWATRTQATPSQQKRPWENNKAEGKKKVIDSS